MWVTASGASLGNFIAFSPPGALIPLLVKHALHGGGVALGLVLAVGGLRGLTATVVAGRRRPPRHRLIHLWVGWGLSGVGGLGLGIVPDVRLAVAVAFLTYALDAYGSVMFNPLFQTAVPSELLGRISSVDYLVGFALSPLGLVAAGVVAELIGVRATLITGGAITALTSLIPLIPGVHDPMISPDDPAGPSQHFGPTSMPLGPYH